MKIFYSFDALMSFPTPPYVLAFGCSETQFFADRRRRALGRLRALRSAAGGLTGLVSAGIEIVPHQVAAVRRVLQDLSLRYLLADEVGWERLSKLAQLLTARP